MKLIPTAVANKFGRQILHVRKASPQIMFVAGVAGVVSAGVLACRSTLKLDDVLEAAEKREQLLELEKEHNEDYSERDHAKHLAMSKAKTVVEIARLYAPAIGLTVLSIGLLTGSHVTLNKRNASLSAAYASLDQAYKQYRQRVIEAEGKSKDDEYRYGTQVVTESVKDENGKTKTVKHVKAADGEPSLYARLFCEGVENWQPEPEYNMIFLRAQQEWANQMLQARGHLFLNEVYDMLGLERSGAGAVVGWVYGNPDGDNRVDFGLYDEEGNERIRDFVNLREASILLDFNVDGEIFHLI